MREKQKLEVTFDFEEACDFLRCIHSGHKVEEKKKLEQWFEMSLTDANISTFVAIQQAILRPEIDTSDFMAGLKVGLTLALAVARPHEKGSIREFMAHWKSKGQNVADISEAFRKRNQI